METKQTAIVLADISGYTRFTRLHQMSLLHAEQIITDLMEAVIDTSKHPLTVSKLEGDAIFFYALSNGDEEATTQDVLRQVTAFFEAFRAKQRELIWCNMCSCAACQTVGDLTLKVVLHHGEVAFKQVKQFEELAGQAVILAHRLLKNTIQAKEYLILSKRFYELSAGLPDQKPEVRREDAEGMGEVEVYVYYLTPETELPSTLPLRSGSFIDKVRQFARLEKHLILRLMGIKHRQPFAHLPP